MSRGTVYLRDVVVGDGCRWHLSSMGSSIDSGGEAVPGLYVINSLTVTAGGTVTHLPSSPSLLDRRLTIQVATQPADTAVMA